MKKTHKKLGADKAVSTRFVLEVLFLGFSAGYVLARDKIRESMVAKLIKTKTVKTS